MEIPTYKLILQTISGFLSDRFKEFKGGTWVRIYFGRFDAGD